MIFADLILHPGSIAVWLFVGLIIGGVAAKMMENPSYGIMGDLLLGSIGAVVGGGLVGLFVEGDPAFWLAAAIFSIVLSGMAGMITNLAPVAIDQGIKPRDAALLISVYGACGFTAKLTFAAVADRLSPRTLMFISLTGFAIGMACLTQAAAGYWMIALGVGLIGLFGGFMVPLQSLLVPRIFGQRVVGRAMGLISMVMLVALLSSCRGADARGPGEPRGAGDARCR